MDGALIWVIIFVVVGLGTSIAYVVAPRELFRMWHGWQVEGDPEPTRDAVGVMRLRGVIGIMAVVAVIAIFISLFVDRKASDEKNAAEDRINQRTAELCETVLPRLEAGLVYDENGLLTNLDELEQIINEPDVAIHEPATPTYSNTSYDWRGVVYEPADDADMKLAGETSVRLMLVDTKVVVTAKGEPLVHLWCNVERLY